MRMRKLVRKLVRKLRNRAVWPLELNPVCRLLDMKTRTIVSIT